MHSQCEKAPNPNAPVLSAVSRPGVLRAPTVISSSMQQTGPTKATTCMALRVTAHGQPRLCIKWSAGEEAVEVVWRR